MFSKGIKIFRLIFIFDFLCKMYLYYIMKIIFAFGKKKNLTLYQKMSINAYVFNKRTKKFIY